MFSGLCSHCVATGTWFCTRQHRVRSRFVWIPPWIPGHWIPVGKTSCSVSTSVSTSAVNTAFAVTSAVTAHGRQRRKTSVSLRTNLAYQSLRTNSKPSGACVTASKHYKTFVELHMLSDACAAEFLKSLTPVCGVFGGGLGAAPSSHGDITVMVTTFLSHSRLERWVLQRGLRDGRVITARLGRSRAHV